MSKFVRCEECLAWRFTTNGEGTCQKKAPKPAIFEGKPEGRKFFIVLPATEKDHGCLEGVQRNGS